MNNLMWLILIVFWLTSASFTAYIASQKNRSTSNWFLLGLFFGIFALIAIAAIPSLSNPENNINNSISKNIGLQHWTCSKCGQMNGFAVNVCSNCGTSKIKICEKCGKPAFHNYGSGKVLLCKDCAKKGDN